MDTNLHFCRRLAEEVLRPPALDAAPLFDLEHELERILGRVPSPLDVDRLVEHLLDSPRAQAELAALSEYTPSKWLLERELEARGLWSAPPPESDLHAADAYAVAADANATGLCFSGGGIRSATFNLGVLQALASARRLGQFTYLSSVSGGGYIHQFLAAWIHNRSVSHDAVPANIAAAATAMPVPLHRTPLEEVEELLEPLPEPQYSSIHTGGKAPFRTLAAQPLRWLTRYSNYLAPRKGLLGLDTWTIFAVWLRNTLLNLIVLLSFFIALLLLPHIPITRWIIGRSTAMHHQGVFDIVVAVAMFVCFFLPGVLFSRWVRYSDCPSEHNPPVRQILVLVLVLFTAACIAAPAVYRSSLPCEFSYSTNQDQFAPCRTAQQVRAADRARRTAPSVDKDPKPVVNPVFDEPETATTELHYSAHFQQQTRDHEPDTLTVEADSHTPTPVSDLRTHWADRPVSFLPHPLDGAAFVPGHWSAWITRQTSFPATRIAFVLGNAAALLLLGFSARDEVRSAPAGAASKEPKADLAGKGRPGPFVLANAGDGGPRATGQQPTRPPRSLRVWAYPILAVVGIAFSWLLLFGVRTLFFVAAFSVRPELISSLGVVLLPTLLFGVPFVTLELGVGLVGDLLTDEKREWIARLRAASFLAGAGWLVLTGFSLLGPEVFDWIANRTATRWTVWIGWLATTLAGVLAGRSSHTTGSADPDELRSKTSALLQGVTAVAPPIFIAGLLLLVAKLTNWSIASAPTPYVQPAHLHIVAIAFIAFAAVFFAFGWRININDFSMHSFYRDRLARCYAGASNPHRKPNTFTGFAPTDRQLPLGALLGRDWRHAPGAAPADSTAYTGPFPVICTAVNLTTGEDLAYQERKAASFAFTPLFSGFDTGVTAGTDKRVQFNGFVRTDEYVYTHHDGVSLATAVAISGAAASPNMGYHSSPAMAFLMTVFNVRLGWWLRNPRRRPLPVPGAPAGSLDAVKLPPSVPPFGPLRLLDELLGQANDSSSYIYLTDGGHFDNMGLYELIRRRCRRIVVCDAESDAQLHFEGLGMAIRKARLDFGVEITLNGIDPDLTPATAADTQAAKASTARPATSSANRPRLPPLADNSDNTSVPDAEAAEPASSVLPSQPMTVRFETQTSEAGEVGVTGEIAPANLTREQVHGVESFKLYPGNATHAVVGTIRYPEAPNDPGHILYIKSSLTGDEPVDVLNFRREHKSFPNDTTLNQFFTESQFESYRRLGQHIVEQDATVQRWLTSFLPLA